VEQLRPRIFCVADDDGVGVRLRVFRDERHVRPAEDDGDAATSKVIREFVRAHRGSGDDGEADEIGVEIQRDIGDTLVNQSYVRR
jgi:hypothetical protein